MDFDSKYIFSTVFLAIGILVGAGTALNHTQNQIDSLNQTFQQERVTKIVNVNYSEEQALAELFQDTDQSAVSVTAIGSDNAQGSGFVYDRKGHIVTNEHVVEGATRVRVNFLDGSTRNAEIVGADPYTDLAVLKVDKNNLQPLDLADSSEVSVGQRAAAIGNPFGLRSSMTSGIISQKGRTLRTAGEFSTPNVLQTDAAINPGNSGGPLLNIQGEVVGVNTAIESRTGTFSGVGFAIPANTVKEVVPELIDDGEFGHPWIGVSGLDLNPDISQEMGLNTTAGFLVVDVVEDSPASKAGLRAGNEERNVTGRELRVGGDVITAIDGQRMRGINDVLLYLSRDTEVGQTIELTVIRDGERIKVPLTLESRPSRN